MTGATTDFLFQIFLPYGKVQDVYLMRDEMKQSRGSSPCIMGCVSLFYKYI